MRNLLLGLMAILPASCKASSQKHLKLGIDGRSASGSDDWNFAEQVKDIATSVDMLELRNELAETRNEFRLQTDILKNVAADMNDIEEEYRSRANDGHGARHSSMPSSSQAKDAVTSKSKSLGRSKHSSKLSESKQKPADSAEKTGEDEEDDQGNKTLQQGFNSNILRALVQLLIGVIYFYLIVQHYPPLTADKKPTPEAIELQNLNPLAASLQAQPKICLCSYCCPGPRAAHTFESTGVMGYWPALLLMSCFPCCTLFATNTFTDLNVRLGGEQMSLIAGCLSACFCSCCLIAQDAESLDLVMGVRTGLLGMERPQDRLMQAAAGQALHHMV